MRRPYSLSRRTAGMGNVTKTGDVIIGVVHTLADGRNQPSKRGTAYDLGDSTK